MIRPAASGSVGEITAPSANAAAHGSPASAWGDDRHSRHRHEHEPDRHQRDPAQVLPDVAEVREERAVDQDRQEHDEHDVRIEIDRRNARDEPEQRAADHEHDRVRIDRRRASAPRPAIATSRPPISNSALPTTGSVPHRARELKRSRPCCGCATIGCGTADRRRRRALPPVLPNAPRARLAIPVSGTPPRGSAMRCLPISFIGRSLRMRSRPRPDGGTTWRCGPGRWRAATTACGVSTTVRCSLARPRRPRSADRDGRVRRSVQAGAESGTGLLIAADQRWYVTLSDLLGVSDTWSDPFVFKDPAGDGWHMLITARATGCAPVPRRSPRPRPERRHAHLGAPAAGVRGGGRPALASSRSHRYGSSTASRAGVHLPPR